MMLPYVYLQRVCVFSHIFGSGVFIDYVQECTT